MPFAAGWAILLAGSASAPAGAAGNVATELAGRAVQGARAALIAPSALTLLMMLFRSDPKELTKAVGLYGAAAPAGGTAGVFLGGVITEYVSWPWVFYLNIPVALLALAGTFTLMPQGNSGTRGSVDWLSALLATAGLGGAVFGIVRAPEVGWASVQTWGVFGAAVLLLGAFVALQAARREPLMRLGIFRAANLGGGEPGTASARRGLDSDVVLPEPVPAAGPRLQRLPIRSSVAADDSAHHGRNERAVGAGDGAVRAKGHDRCRAWHSGNPWQDCRSSAHKAPSG